MRLALSGNGLRGTSLIKSAGELITKGGNCMALFLRLRDWGPFLESPGNFTGPKSNIQIEI